MTLVLTRYFWLHLRLIGPSKKHALHNYVLQGGGGREGNKRTFIASSFAHALSCVIVRDHQQCTPRRHDDLRRCPLLWQSKNIPKSLLLPLRTQVYVDEQIEERWGKKAYCLQVVPSLLYVLSKDTSRKINQKKKKKKTHERNPLPTETNHRAVPCRGSTSTFVQIVVRLPFGRINKNRKVR